MATKRVFVCSSLRNMNVYDLYKLNEHDRVIFNEFSKQAGKLRKDPVTLNMVQRPDYFLIRPSGTAKPKAKAFLELGWNYICMSSADWVIFEKEDHDPNLLHACYNYGIPAFMAYRQKDGSYKFSAVAFTAPIGWDDRILGGNREST